jgi:hypothetical protein
MTSLTGNSASLLVFAKAPEPGSAKTRLIPLLGAEGAARVQARLTRRAVGTALSAHIGRVELWCAPDRRHPLFSSLGAEKGITLHNQCEGDIGERMRHAATRSLARDRYTLILGTDCPQLTARHLQTALASLQKGKHAVLIPAEDGGYVMLGLARVAPELFRPIDWGTHRVMAQTRERLKSLSFDFDEMPPLPDLDRPEDGLRLGREWPQLWRHLISGESIP